MRSLLRRWTASRHLTLFFGEYAEALTYAQRVRRRTTSVVQRAQIAHSGIDYSILPRCIVAEILWLQNLLDQSPQTTRDLLADTEASGHPVSLCQALASAGCRISLRLGDLEAAERSIARLKDHAEKHSLNSYYACGLGYEGQLSAKRGDIAAGERLLRVCLAGLREAHMKTFTRHSSAT